MTEESGVKPGEREERLKDLAICAYCKLHPEEIGEPEETCWCCDELRKNVEAAYELGQARGGSEDDLRECRGAAQQTGDGGSFAGGG